MYPIFTKIAQKNYFSVIYGRSLCRNVCRDPSTLIFSKYFCNQVPYIQYDNKNFFFLNLKAFDFVLPFNQQMNGDCAAFYLISLSSRLVGPERTAIWTVRDVS